MPSGSVGVGVLEHQVQHILLDAVEEVARVVLIEGAGDHQAGAGDDDRLAGLERYARCVGLAFQVHDDVLDVSGETAVLGKTQGKDAAQEKTTYATLLGLAEARSRAQLLYRDALATLETFGEKADPLRAIAETIISRNS